MSDHDNTRLPPSIEEEEEAGINEINGYKPSNIRPSVGRNSLDSSTWSLGTASTVTVEEKDYALLYAYALVTGQVAQELEVVAKVVEELFGKLDEERTVLLQ